MAHLVLVRKRPCTLNQSWVINYWTCHLNIYCRQKPQEENEPKRTPFKSLIPHYFVTYLGHRPLGSLQAEGSETSWKRTRFLDFLSISVVCVGGSKALDLDFWISLKQLYEISPVLLTLAASKKKFIEYKWNFLSDRRCSG